MVSASTQLSKRGRPPTGKAQTAAERMRRYRARRRALGLRAVTRYESPPPARLRAGELDARLVEARDLALRCLAAKKIDQRRPLLNKVRARLEYWRRNYTEEPPPATLDRWADVLSGTWPAIALLMMAQTPEAARLRRLTPFAVVLTANERKRIYSAFAL